jgi:deazaflavin-dependent oxidoreductase (nitroreductase family)
VRSTSSGIFATRSDVTFVHMPNLEDFNNDFHAFNEALIDEFRTNAGQVTGIFAGAPLVLITTTGAKSGRKRTTPIVYTTDGDDVVIIASKGGAPTSPDWFHNLVANPDVTVELPNEKFEARARVAEEPERERLYRAQAALMPNFSEYEKATTRQIPVVVIERV